MRFRVVPLLTLLAVACTAETISPAERQKALDYLARTGTKLSSSISSLSEAQWNFKSAPERWSVRQCVEHIAVTEMGVLQRIRGSLSQPAPAGLSVKRDGLILQVMPDRSRKATAPAEVAPVGRPEFEKPSQALAAFERARRATQDFIGSTDADLRTHGLNHFALGDLDAYQWVLFLATHCERHTKQIEEVMADAGFPK
ncbi:MAG: DinB family protein [Acidobacteria bacterium]|nr:DinB family protein [Acidobacteriota bacterium]